MHAADGAGGPVRRSPWRRGAALISHHIRLHPRLFFTAVAGAAVFALCTVASAIVTGWVIDHVIIPRFEDGEAASGALLTGVALVIGVGIVRAIGVVVRRTFASAAQWRVAETLTDQVIDRLDVQPLQWHQRYATGDLVARAGVDVEAATNVMGPLPFASSTIVLLAVSSVWLLLTDPVLGGVAVALFPVMIVLNVSYQHRVDRHLDEAQHHLGQLSAAVHESFDGVMVVKAFGAERREAERLSTIAGYLREARIRAVAIRATFEALLDAIPTVANVILVVLGAWRVKDGDMTVGEVTAFIYLFTLLVLPLRLIGYALSELPHSLAGYARVREVLDDPTEHDPQEDVLAAPAELGVSLRGISFEYEPGRPVLSGVSTDVLRGATVALVGATGAGKTTLLQIVAGLLPASAGQVARDDGDCCLVFQEPFLFASSLADNVTLGDGDGDGDGYGPEAVRRALELAEATEFVDQLEAGVGTEIGERGVSLSGGQRQRIALARALVRQPKVLLLDDTTSALDPGTEARILSNLRRGLSGVTTIVVASRPSTIALADEVVYLDGGRVIARGPHEQLVRDVPSYRMLVDAYETDRTHLAGEPPAVQRPQTAVRA
jgi:ABC-type multidrug transport system fused ATPase/permease subunit